MDMHAPRILVLHTGGTIGMVPGPDGFVPSAGALATAIGGNAILGASRPVEKKSARTVGLSSRWGAEMDSYVTRPAFPYGPVAFDLAEHDPVLDSSNLALDDWSAFATAIADAYTHYDGFVLLHGTDTMAYTACALSFMFANLGKPVVITGSQIPLSASRNDAESNLTTALLAAAYLPIREVTVVFRDTIFRGNRVTKVDAAGLAAFESPNYPSLGRFDSAVHFHEARALAAPTDAFRVAATLSPHVAALRLFPGITANIAENILQSPLCGLVLETYGAGNAPNQDHALLRVFRDASERGVVIVNVTQCLRGSVVPTYASGNALTRAGVISGSDMTVEAALTKLAWLLAQGLSVNQVRAKMVRAVRGELTE